MLHPSSFIPIPPLLPHITPLLFRPMESARLTAPPPLVALLGWLIPGSGYWLIGQRSRAVTIGLTILVLFVMGVLIGGIRVVEAPDMGGNGAVTTRILQHPWFLGQVLAGP